MDKSTLSQYGWVVIVIIIIAILLGLATPFGNFVKDSIYNTATSFGDTINDSLNFNDNGDVGDNEEDIESPSDTVIGDSIMISAEFVETTYFHASIASELNTSPRDCMNRFLAYCLGQAFDTEEEARSFLDEYNETGDDFIHYSLDGFMEYFGETSETYFNYIESINLENESFPMLGFYFEDAIKIVFEDKLPDDSINVVDFSAPICTETGGKVVAWMDDSLTLHIAGNGKVIAPSSSVYLFGGLSNVEFIDFNKSFDTSRICNADGMFYELESLKELNLADFDTAKVVNMSDMFSKCSSLTSLDLSNFDTSKTQFMISMFYKCSSLTSLNLSNFNTSNVEDMSKMFYSCSSLTSLNLSSFNTTNVRYMESMFSYCSSLKHIYVGDTWDLSNVSNKKYMFIDCGTQETELKAV